MDHSGHGPRSAKRIDDLRPGRFLPHPAVRALGSIARFTTEPQNHGTVACWGNRRFVAAGVGIASVCSVVPWFSGESD